MKKTFWITTALFVIIIKWEVITENNNFEGIFMITFLLFALSIKFFYVTIFLIPFMIWFLVTLISKTDSEIIKITGLSFFIFVTAMQLIFAFSLLPEKPIKKEIVASFGSEERMLEVIKERIIVENPSIDFHLMEQEYSEEVDEGRKLPSLNYVFNVTYTDEDNAVYSGGFETSVMCSGGTIDDCHLIYSNFENLKTDEGKEVIKETDEEFLERTQSEDYNYNPWEINPHY
ncbi:hypothetical protein MKZ25_07985 [Solibacillus sp. FSL W7-1464]|uniref:hypothetical protein n=1 Tax=Solibacillus sp. FSL W7-1464 TaxID=2921706 RepID=UPI0030F63E14